mgnify:CR=1 FL=1
MNWSEDQYMDDQLAAMQAEAEANMQAEAEYLAQMQAEAEAQDAMEAEYEEYKQWCVNNASALREQAYLEEKEMEQIRIDHDKWIAHHSS